MTRKSASSALALTGLIICLGALGHTFMGRNALDTGLAHAALDPRTGRLVHLVWYFAGGCMLVFGLLVTASAWRAWRGEKDGMSTPGLIGVFYLLFGISALLYMKEPFWTIFVVLGALSLMLSMIIAADRRAVNLPNERS